MPATKGVPLDLKDGKPRRLYFGTDGLMLVEAELAKVSGSKLPVPIAALIYEPFSLTVAMQLLWGGLVWEDSTLTLAGAKALYEDYRERTGEPYTSLKDPIVEALFAAVLRRDPHPNGEASRPNGQTEVESNIPSPNGGGA